MRRLGREGGFVRKSLGHRLGKRETQCGGSTEGWCEVFPGKRKCIFVRAYDRLKPYGEEESLGKDYIPPRNWALDQTSSWTNYFLGRDHHSQK